MSVDTAPSLRPGARAQLRRSARRRAESPLYRNGYALIASSGLTSALGLVYWLVAARNYSPYAVGIGSALIAAMTTIANLCHLNLKSALNRFLPRGGRAAGGIVVRSYLVALLVSAVVSVAFVAGTGLWAGHLSFLRHNPLIGLGFVVATMAWTIFVLQDSALTGVRQAIWVPLENLLYSVAKLALLVMLVTAAPHLGPFVAWSAVVPLVVVVVNVFLFKRLLPAHARATEQRAERVTARAVVRYVATDYVAYLMMTATIGLLPLVVLAALGPAANAHYFVAWSIAYGLYLIASGMGMSMISEAAHDPGSLSRYRRETLWETAKIVVPCALVVALAAPQILQLLGHGYASAAGTLLRLLALSALPWIVFATYTNEARVERRMRSVVIATAALFGLVLAIGLPLLGPMGINGLGVGWLAAQSIVAAAILGRGVTARSVGRLLEAAVPVAITARRRYDRIAALGPPGAARFALAELRRRPGWSRFVIQRRLVTVNDVSVAIVGPRGGPPAAVLKRARTTHGDASLADHARVLVGLKRARELGDFRDIVPDTLASGVAGGHGYLVESHLDGIPMEIMLEGGGGIDELLDEAATAIGCLHAATARQDRIDPELMRELVGEPLVAVRDAVLRHSALPAAERGLELVREVLEADLADRPARTGWVHGDFSPPNVLMASDGTVTGIVDWERSRERGMPELDLLQLAFSTRCAIERRELGPVVAGMLQSPRWRPHERALEAALGEREEGSLPIRALVLLAWLQHAASNVGKSARYAASGLWVRRNIDPVLGSLLPAPAAAPGLGDGGIVAAPRARWRLRRSRARARSFATGRGLALPLAALGVAATMWALSLAQIEPRAMTDLGLISVLPPMFVAALIVVTLSFASLIHRRSPRSWLLGAHVLALIVFIHATPTLAYGTLRYSWAFKHVGIVDYIIRHGSIDPAIHALPVYHNWPGFFALIALLLKSAGLPNAMSLATWGPVFNNILYLGALVFLFSGLTRSRRTVWLGCWLFVLSNWVGQDYFSPQGFAFVLYLLLLGIVVRWLGTRADEVQQPRRSVAVVLAVLVLAAIAPSHALTSVMAAIALTALVVTRVCRVRALPVMAGALTLVWDLVFAWDYTSGNLESTVTQIHLPWATASSTLTKFGSLSPDQAHVATIARGLTAGVVVLAAAGVLAQLRSGRFSRAAVVLAAAPVLLFATGNYDGEILFRIFLFSVPFLAFLAAHALLAGPARLRPAITAVVAVALLGGFLVSYYGKERLNYFTPDEVAAARFVDTRAPAHSLLIDGTNNYPFAFKNYERFTYVSIALEPRSSWSQVLAHPVAVLSRWMHDPRYRSAYLILTRSQDIEVESYGDLPRGSLDRVRAALLASPQFRVAFRNRDATVFTLASAKGAS